MPVMNGLEATAAIRKLDSETAKHIPIIALTANAYHEDIQKCLAAGMNAHLSKPINIDRAVRTIIECARTGERERIKEKGSRKQCFREPFCDIYCLSPPNIEI